MGLFSCSNKGKGSLFSRLKRFLLLRRWFLIIVLKLVAKILDDCDGE